MRGDHRNRNPRLPFKQLRFHCDGDGWIVVDGEKVTEGGEREVQFRYRGVPDADMMGLEILTHDSGTLLATVICLRLMGQFGGHVWTFAFVGIIEDGSECVVSMPDGWSVETREHETVDGTMELVITIPDDEDNRVTIRMKE